MAGRKIICESCNTTFQEDLLGDAIVCPVCGKSLVDGVDKEKGWITWWYYKDPKYGDYSLWDKQPNDPDALVLIKEFKAPPENNPGGLDAVKDILRTYVPGAFEFPEPITPQIRCPRCFSTEFQLIPKKFSLLTGFATNRFDRVCNKCGKRF